MRTLFILVFVVFLSACSSKLAYNNLDWWVYWYLDDYIELKEGQEEKFDDHLQNWLRWHKTTELRRYKAHLSEIKATGATYQVARSWAGFWKNLG